VLWALSLLALLAAQVTGAGRAETRTAEALRAGAALEAAADAAVHETVWHLLDGSGETWAPGGPPHLLREGGFAVTVQVTDDRGKLDVNQAPAPILQALFEVLGADAPTAHAVAAAIVDFRTPSPQGIPNPVSRRLYASEGRAWGPSGQDYETLRDLLLVRGMTPALYQAASPYLTIDLEQGPARALAAPVLLAALAKAQRDTGSTMDDPDPHGPEVLEIVAQASGPAGAGFTRRATIRLDGSINGAPWKWRVLDWSSGG
jgi:general secretion pathway protein K